MKNRSLSQNSGGTLLSFRSDKDKRRAYKLMEKRKSRDSSRKSEELLAGAENIGEEESHEFWVRRSSEDPHQDSHDTFGRVSNEKENKPKWSNRKMPSCRESLVTEESAFDKLLSSARNNNHPHHKYSVSGKNRSPLHDFSPSDDKQTSETSPLYIGGESGTITANESLATLTQRVGGHT